MTQPTELTARQLNQLLEIELDAALERLFTKGEI